MRHPVVPCQSFSKYCNSQNVAFRLQLIRSYQLKYDSVQVMSLPMKVIDYTTTILYRNYFLWKLYMYFSLFVCQDSYTLLAFCLIIHGTLWHIELVIASPNIKSTYIINEWHVSCLTKLTRKIEWRAFPLNSAVYYWLCWYWYRFQICNFSLVVADSNITLT